MRRKVDALGRVVLPAEYRETLHIQKDDEVKIVLRPDGIQIELAVFRCIFCSGEAALTQRGNVCVCRFCIEGLYRENSV